MLYNARMITPQGHQCDACDKFADSGDEFFKFACTGVATVSDPTLPARMLLCPSCKESVARSFKISNGRAQVKSWTNVDLSHLPPGRLKRILTRVQTKQRMKDIGLF